MHTRALLPTARNHNNARTCERAALMVSMTRFSMKSLLPKRTPGSMLPCGGWAVGQFAVVWLVAVWLLVIISDSDEAAANALSYPLAVTDDALLQAEGCIGVIMRRRRPTQ